MLHGSLDREQRMRLAVLAIAAVLALVAGAARAERLVGWGDGAGGQLSAPADIASFSAVSTGDEQTCVLGADGQPTCFGCLDKSADFGQCDPAPAPPGLVMPYGGRRTSGAALAALSAGNQHTCAVAVDGTVQCWGCMPNHASQCLVPEGLRAASVAAGRRHTCAVGEDGLAHCWGCDRRPFPECAGPEGRRAKAVALAQRATCLLGGDGDVACWGSGAAAAPPPGLRAAALAGSGSGDAMCAVSVDGALACWGDDAPRVCPGAGCLPASPPSGRWVAVSVGKRGACALDDSGRVACGGCPEAGAGACAAPGWLRGASAVSVSGDHGVAVVPDSVVPEGWRPPTGEARTRAAIVAARPRQGASGAWLADRGDWSNWLGMRFRAIPAGAFTMGSCVRGRPCPGADPDAFDAEWPPHEVAVGAFQMALFPVTVGEWRAFAAATGRPPAAGFDEVNAVPDWYPVTWVSWDDAQAFVAWLNAAKPAGDAGTYRLPTEAEWEYAARGGAATRYWFGDEATGAAMAACVDCDPARSGPAPVGSYPANPFGLYDMLGEVSQWVEDCFHPGYGGAPVDGSAWGEPGCRPGMRVARGGGWEYKHSHVRAAYRGFNARDGRTWKDGFRVVRTVR
jgi:formylglycine-generating enzyme required for sulfatase activity